MPRSPLRSANVLLPAMLVLLVSCEQDLVKPSPDPTMTVLPTAEVADGVITGAIPTGAFNALATPQLASVVLGANDLVLPAIARQAMLGANNALPHSLRNIRYQQIFLASEVGGVQSFGALCLRPDDYFGSDALQQEITLKLGPSDQDLQSIGLAFDANYSAPPTTVYSGTFEMPATAPGDVNDWVACIEFDVPYDHPGGALIVEMVNASPLTGAVWIADFCNAPPFGGGQADCNTTRVYANDPTASTASAKSVNQGLAMRLVAIEPAERVGGLERWVTDLENDGALNGGQSTALMAKLDVALAMIANGRTRVAMSVLAAFINQVQDLMDEGVLTPAEALPLIEEATNIIAQLEHG